MSLPSYSSHVSIFYVLSSWCSCNNPVPIPFSAGGLCELFLFFISSLKQKGMLNAFYDYLAISGRRLILNQMETWGEMDFQT